MLLFEFIKFLILSLVYKLIVSLIKEIEEEDFV